MSGTRWQAGSSSTAPRVSWFFADTCPPSMTLDCHPPAARNAVSYFPSRASRSALGTKCSVACRSQTAQRPSERYQPDHEADREQFSGPVHAHTCRNDTEALSCRAESNGTRVATISASSSVTVSFKASPFSASDHVRSDGTFCKDAKSRPRGWIAWAAAHLAACSAPATTAGATDHFGSPLGQNRPSAAE